MRTRPELLLLLALLLFAACTRVEKGQPSQASQPVPRGSQTPESKSSQPNQVTVSIGKTSPEIARLNPRFVEGHYLPAGMRLVRNGNTAFRTTPQTQDESLPAGMKWLVVIVELDATQGNSVPLSNIRIVDQSNRSYKLRGISFRVDSDTFVNVRRVSGAAATIHTPIAHLKMLFAVASEAQGLSLEL